MNGIRGLGHICFRTHKAEEMVGFYRDRLGLALQFVFRGRDGSEFGWYLALGNRTFLEIFDVAGAARQWGGEPSQLKPNDGVRYQHFCVEVEGIEAFRERLVAGGLEVTPVKQGMDGSKQAWTKDPDGNAIELMEYTPASLQIRASETPLVAQG